MKRGSAEFAVALLVVILCMWITIAVYLMAGGLE
jgi:hypothetical protein